MYILIHRLSKWVLAQWSSSGLLSGAGSVEDSWLQLSGSDSGNFGIEYIARDDFYQDDGCYTLRFTLIWIQLLM